MPANLQPELQFYRMEADAMFELATLYRDGGDLATADARATQGLAASQRVGDRYYVPRNLTMLADLKARRGHFAEANALYEQAEDVIEGMLISVDEPYWNSSVAAAMSRDLPCDTLNSSPRMAMRPELSQFWNAFEAELSHGLLKTERHCPQRNQIKQPRWKAMLQVSRRD